MHYLKSIAIIAVLILGVTHSVEAQTKAYSSKEALELFKEGNYAEAEKAYAYLLGKYDREVKYNYYYGICLLKNNNDISQAVKRLRYAAMKGVSRDAYYYLGRAYQLTYEFTEAIKQYERFLRYASASDIRNEHALKYKSECEFGLKQAAKIFSLTVYQRDTVAADAILSAYHPARDVGKVMHNEAFFESGLDPKGILYLTERGDEVYFSMKSEEQGEAIYKMEKLLDGWSESKAIEAINSEADDYQPFVLIDGSTIFFASNREGGLGGYDLYKAYFDAETKTFLEPVNMGIPFNSPKDDFLFVADEFNGIAWFASNRETNDSTLIVYSVKWDDQVVKNFVEDINQVRAEAALTLSGEVFDDGGDGDKKAGDAQKNKGIQFHFLIADTLEYTHIDHFKSEEAKKFYQEGTRLQSHRDGLADLMKQKRYAYARTNSEAELSALVNDILALEKKVYGLDDLIEENFYQSRVKEIEKIKAMIAAGSYNSAVGQKKPKAGIANLEEIFIPKDYTFYADEEFARQLAELELMYSKLFSPDEINKLNSSDSLYIWGNILTLESSKLLEKANNMTEQSESVLDVLREKDSIDELSSAQSYVDKAADLKKIAIALYHKSLDLKYAIYDEKLQELRLIKSDEDLSFLENAQAEGRAYMKEATEILNPMLGYSSIDYEKAGAIKRAGVGMQEQGLKTFADMEPGNIEIQEEESPKRVPKTYQELQGSVEELKQPAQVVADAFSKATGNGLVYKIQIGVFRNEPDEAAVAKIPPISRLALPSKGLTKYFAGEYSSYADAQKDIKQVQAAGFSGAFIVVFKDGKQINLTDELKR
ncbi:hypothetical protein [Carboxylicivirga taeanensis]|uniref:hypothetical protein n=1 Tax=Carboxylicivirga taeanensis TaxID=1416875 RepID=UPI003F6E0149